MKIGKLNMSATENMNVYLETNKKIIEEPKEELEEIELLGIEEQMNKISTTNENYWKRLFMTKINELIANQNKIIREKKEK